MTDVLTGIEPCGCIRAVWVLGEHDPDAYRDAAKWAKAGCAVVSEPIEDWRHRNSGALYCSDHLASSGPPTWARVKMAAQQELEF